MFKLLRLLSSTIPVIALILFALSACAGAQPIARITPVPTEAVVIQASPTALTAQASPTSVAAQATPTTVAALEAMTKTVTTPKALTTVATTEAMTETSPLASKPTPTVSQSTPAASQPTPAASQPGATTVAQAAVVKPAGSELMIQMSSDAKLGDILTDDKGMTLYIFKNDKPGQSACDDACAKTWTPLAVANEAEKVTAAKEVSGKLGVIERKDGTYQVTYNDMPLYTYSKDTKTGQTLGENVNNLWHVATVGMTATGMPEPAKPAASSITMSGKIALLLPASKTTRYETADRPYFEARLKELCPACEIIYSNANQDVKTQLSQAEAALTNGAKVLVLDPVDPAAAALIADKAKAQGVPVIAYDRLILNSQGVNYYVSLDSQKVGELQAQSLVDELNELGKKNPQIVLFNGSLEDNTARLLKEGAHSVFDPLVKEKKLTIAKEFDIAQANMAQVQSDMKQTLTTLSNKVDGVYAANDQIAGDTIAAMRAAGLKTFPPVTGQEAELAAVQRILAGEQYMTVYHAIKPEAEAAAQLAYDLLSKTTVPANMTAGKMVNNGKMDVPSILFAPVAVTKNNIKDTIVQDKFLTVAQICTTEYASACKVANLE